MTTTSSHRWRFFRAGGFDQVRLDRGEDLVHLPELDQTLWLALACPTRGIEFDTVTLDLIDTDKDQRIRAPEILAAVKWAVSVLKNPDELVAPAASLDLSAINDSTDEGKTILASARQILSDLGKPAATAISVDDLADTARIFAQTNFNGDGIIPADAAEDPATKSAIDDIIVCLGSEKDRSGKPGVTQPKVDLFFVDAQSLVTWHDKNKADALLSPLGENTPAAALALAAVRTKVDDYFARCRLAAFDARALAALNREEKEYLVFAAKDLTISTQEIAAFPLSRIEPNRALPLTDGLNPAWAAAIATFRAAVVVPLLGDRGALTEADWATVTARLAPFETWSASKPKTCAEQLGLPRVRELLASGAREKITALIARDKALEPQATAIAAVHKLVRFKRDLYKLLNNFVNFRDFYARRDKASFQVGRLYLDQRACDLCVRVDDAAKHGAMAHLSQAYLAYCDCVRKSTGEKISIAAAFTAGDSDNLMVGRNGVFYDRAGNDYDATITKVIENPISIRQAFWAPYKRLLRWIEDAAAKRAAAADAASQSHLQAQTATLVDAAGKPIPPAAPAPAEKKFDVGVIAALGVAIGFISTAAASILAWLTGSPPQYIPLYIVGILLAISLPSMVIAWLKLRQRNLAPILDANGWAVNARAKINIPFGRSLTHQRTLPAGAQRDLRDPYQEKTSRRWGIAIVLIAGYLLWVTGLAAFAYTKYTQWWNGPAPTPTTLPSPATTPATAPASATAPTPAEAR